MKARDVFEASCGIGGYGNSRALVRVQTGFIDRRSLEESTLEHYDMDNPIVEIHQNAKLTLVNLSFGDSGDPDFIYISDMIKRFQVMDASIDDERMPSLSLTIMPKELDGSYVYGVSGIAFLQSSTAFGSNDTVSFVFTNDCIHAYMLEMEEVG